MSGRSIDSGIGGIVGIDLHVFFNVSSARLAGMVVLTNIFFTSFIGKPIFGTGIPSNKMGGEFGLAFFVGGLLFLPLEVFMCTEVDGGLFSVVVVGLLSDVLLLASTLLCSGCGVLSEVVPCGGLLFLPWEVVGSNEVDGELVFVVVGELRSYVLLLASTLLCLGDSVLSGVVPCILLLVWPLEVFLRVILRIRLILKLDYVLHTSGT